MLIRVFGLESTMFARFQQQGAAAETIGVRCMLLETLVSLSARSVVLFSRVIAVGIGIFLVTSGSMTIGDFVAFLSLLTLANIAIDDLNRTVLPDFVSATSSIQRVKEFLAEVPDIVEYTGAIAISPVQRQIKLQNVFLAIQRVPIN